MKTFNVKDLISEVEATANIAYQSFVKHISEHKNGLFCFYEGKDGPFYYPRIRNFYKGEYYPIVAGNKSKVLTVLKLINCHSEYDKYKLAFFIDRDFDKSIAKNDFSHKIYETPCYSIENLYVKVEVFKEIIKNEFKFSEVEEDFVKIIKVYKDRQIEFHNAVLLFNCWYSCIKDNMENNGKKLDIQLSEKFPENFLHFSSNEISSKYTIVDIQNRFPNAPFIDENILQTKIIKFNKIDQAYYFRGKYEIEFLFRILNLFINDSNTSKIIVKSKCLRKTISLKDMVSVFSQYAQTPDCLIKYIKQFNEFESNKKRKFQIRSKLLEILFGIFKIFKNKKKNKIPSKQSFQFLFINL